MQLDITTVIFISFLLINLSVGLVYGRGVKNIKDYALGGRNFSTAALVATMIATFMDGAGFFIALHNTYSEGLTYVIATLCITIQLLFVGLILVPRMGEFMGALSIAEAMGNLYGRHVRAVTAICGILLNIGLVGVQFKVFGSLVNYFIGFSEFWAVTIAATIVILYSSFGGIKAVTYTDILQFFTFGFAIPLIGMIIWDHFQSLNLNLSDAFANPLFNYKNLATLSSKEIWDFAFLILYFTLSVIFPHDFQRISMGRDIPQVIKAHLITAILFVVIFLAMVWIPFLIANISPGLDPNNITNHIISHYTYVGLKSLLIIGVSALAMSTADSAINASSVLFAHDLKETLGININNLVLSKLFALILGTAGIYFALSTNNILDMFRTTASFYMPIVIVPLLFSIFGFRSSKNSVLAGMAAGFITVITLLIFKADELNMPGMLANTIVLFSYHYLTKQPGGWIGIKDRAYLDAAKILRRKKIIKLVSNLSFKNFITLCKKSLPKNEMMYMWLGVYFILFTISTMYSTHIESLKDSSKTVFYIYQLMMCTGVITAMYPIWPSRIKYEIIMQIAWYIIIFYMLVLLSSFFVMLSGFGQLQSIIFTLNIVLTAILIGWKLSIVLIPLGFYISLVLYKYYMGITTLEISLGSPQFIFMYSLMLLTMSLIIFIKPQQEYQEFTEEKNNHLNNRVFSSEQQVQAALAVRSEFLRNVTHEYNTPMTGITSLAETLWHSFDNLPANELKKGLEYIFKSANRLKNFEENISSISTISKAGFELETHKVDLSKLVYARVDVCRRFYDENSEEREFDIDIEDDIIIDGDDYYLMQAVDNLVINAIIYCKKGKIAVNLIQDLNNKQVVFSIADEGIGIPKNELYDILADFVVSSKTKTPAGGRGLGLALCQRVIEMHGGKIWATSDGVKGARFMVTLPLDLDLE